MDRVRRRQRRVEQHDHVRLRANVDVDVFDARTGRLLSRQAKHNLTVTAGLNLIRDFLYGDAVAALSHLAVGTGSTAAALTDTTLGTEVFRAALTQKTKASGSLVLKYYLPAGSANGNTLREVGLFNAASTGTLYARVVLGTAIVKTISISVTFTWTLTWS